MDDPLDANNLELTLIVDLAHTVMKLHLSDALICVRFFRYHDVPGHCRAHPSRDHKPCARLNQGAHAARASIVLLYMGTSVQLAGKVFVLAQRSVKTREHCIRLRGLLKLKKALHTFVQLCLVSPSSLEVCNSVVLLELGGVALNSFASPSCQGKAARKCSSWSRISIQTLFKGFRKHFARVSIARRSKR